MLQIHCIPDQNEAVVEDEQIKLLFVHLKTINSRDPEFQLTPSTLCDMSVYRSICIEWNRKNTKALLSLCNKFRTEIGALLLFSAVKDK